MEEFIANCAAITILGLVVGGFLYTFIKIRKDKFK